MTNTIVLAGGCFWGVEGYFQRIEGVLETEVGYANGNTDVARYETLKETDHAEGVRIVYDEAILSLEEILAHFLRIIDPYSVNKQGNDVGRQYRTGVYVADEKEKARVSRILENYWQVEERNHKNLSRLFAIEVEILRHFIPAEDYHQDYLDKNPGGYCHINLDLAKEPLVSYPRRHESEEALRHRLGEEAYTIAREAATEAPRTSPLNQEWRPGIYVDRVSGAPLFASQTKFDAGCGWPSFTSPIEDAVLSYHDDRSHGMRRTEVRSTDADIHLGHVFSDGPEEGGGLRYCMNGAVLEFIPLEEMEEKGYGAYIDKVKEKE